MASEMDLYQHNKLAYRDVMESFRYNDRVCIIHPTGTGKSYIISAVCSNFKKVLILGPNNVVLEQIRHDMCIGVDVTYHTYAYLLHHELCDRYDLIVLDEFHRCGALKWSLKVSELLERSIGCKVFGTTATNIRNFDKRDMAIELFGGNIVSCFDLSDAIKSNILPKPLYIRGLYTFDTIFEGKFNLINKSQLIDVREKMFRIEELRKLRKKWEDSFGVPDILKKYIYGSGINKMAVFCDRISSLEVMCVKLSEWFDCAGLEIGARRSG